MYEKIEESQKIKAMVLEPEVKQALTNDINFKSEKILKKMLKEYCRELVQFILT